MVYADWNVFNVLKRLPDREIESSLEKISSLVSENQNQLYYSEAHLMDLRNSDKMEYLREDLIFLSKMTNDYCIYVDYERNTADLWRINPFHRLVTIGKPKFSKILVENIDSPALFELKKDSETLLDEFKKKHAEVLEEIKNSGSEYEKDLLNEIFPRNNENAFDFIIRYLKQKEFELFTKEGSVIYRDIVESSGIQYDKDNSEHSLYKLETYVKAKTGKSFKAFLAGMPNIKPINNGLFETYTYRDMLGIYQVLDTLGVGHEKYTDKNVAYNVQRDAFHVMYASHAEVFLTNDRNCYRKAKILYEFMDLRTKVILYRDL